MLVEHPVCPILHAFPKTHKNLFPPPLRPIIAGVASLMERVCVWLDQQLQPLVQCVPGYIKDTKEFLKAFSHFQCQINFLWATCDITAFYTTIPHSKAITALFNHLDNFSYFSSTLKQYIISVTVFLLSHNYLVALTRQPVHEPLGGGLSICGQ